MTPSEETTASPSHDVAEGKQTSLGLYVTAREAYAMWAAASERVSIIDVRTPEEYVFVGHAEMARNIPLVFMTYQWDVDKDEPVIRPNPGFLARVQALHSSADALLLICRSGGRSAWAVNALAKAGFKNAYNVIDGTEGDKVDDPGSLYRGQRLKNGWKNSGVPWTYDCDPGLLWTA